MAKSLRSSGGRFLGGINYNLDTQFKNGEPSPRKGVKKPGWTNKTSFKSRRSLWETNAREYQSVHGWIKKQLGKPQFCEICKTEKSLEFNWANISGKYIRDVSDWARMCEKCHKNFDVRNVSIKRAAGEILKCHRNKEIILICGNGGSMEMSTHLAAELVGKFEKKNREPISALALNNVAIITAIGNDFGYDEVFSRQVTALGKKNGLLICLTTSDYEEITKHNINIWKALGTAVNKKRMRTMVIGSDRTIRIANYAGCMVRAGGDNTADIQDNQLVIIHSICREVERHL